MAVTTLNTISWRLYIGPHYDDYDWSGHNVGNSLSTPETTTTSGINGSSTSFTVSDGTNFPTSNGACWVGPNGSGQGWEYMPYTTRSGTSISGVTRESSSDVDHNRIHTVGATVHLWYPVTSNNGTLTLNEEASENLATVTWSASVSGVLAPHYVMRPGHIVVVTTATDGGAHTIFLLGFLDSPQITDNGDETAEWSFNIVSSAQILSQIEADGYRVGENRLSRDASGTTALVLNFDERASGDYTKAEPDLTATSVTDDDDSTLWIAERFKGTTIWLGTTNSDPENYSVTRFSQLYLNPPTSAGAGARWIELRAIGGDNHEGFAIYRADSVLDYVEWQYTGPGSMNEGDSIFLVEDEATFTRLNPHATSVAIYEFPEWFDGIDPTGGEVWLRIPQLNQWWARMRWGHGDGYIDHPDMPSRNWGGSNITAPATGETMRYLFNVTTGFASDYWETGMTRHAGYDLDKTNSEWVMITFPGLNLTLADDITASNPTGSEFLYINGTNGKYSVDGLPSSGTLIIGDEQIAYTSKSTSSGYVSGLTRGANSTTAAAHNADDEVYLLDGSTQTDAFALNEIGWSRAGGTIYPKSFKVYTTNIIDNIRTPDVSDFTDDWTLRATVTAHATSSYSLALANLRVRHALIEIFEMTTDPARPRLNEFYGIMSPSYHDSSLWRSLPTDVDILIEAIAEDAGIPSNAIVTTTGLPVMDNIETQNGGDVWTLISDMAEFAGIVITIGRDSRLHITDDTFWDGTISTAVTWTRSNATQVKMLDRPMRKIAQVELPWRTADGATTGTSVYPATAGVGSKVELNETIYANASAADYAAQRWYFLNTHQREFVVDVAGDGNAYRPRVAHAINWQFHLDHVAVTRDALIVGTSHTLSNGTWRNQLQLVQYGHESNF